VPDLRFKLNLKWKPALITEVKATLHDGKKALRREWACPLNLRVAAMKKATLPRFMAALWPVLLAQAERTLRSLEKNFPPALKTG